MHAIGVRERLTIAGLLGLLGIILVSVIAIHAMRGQMMADRVTKVRNLTEVSLGLIQHHYDRFQRGEISEDGAKKAALDALRPLRYGEDGYIFVDDWDCHSILLPIKPDFEGRDFTDVKDARGDYFVRKQRDTAKAGGGTIYYSFVKPNSDQIANKVSYVLPFAPWRWFVASGVYLDDVDREINGMIFSFLEILGPVVLIVGTVFFFLSRSLTVPLLQLTDIMNRLARRDYDVRIPNTERQDEIGYIARAVLVFRENGRANAELQKEIHRSNEELERFAYVASHDLREPLRVVSSYVTLLERSLADDLTADQKDYIGFARDGAKRMNQLILDLLELSRLGRGSNMVDDVDLRTTLDDAIANLQLAISESNATITLPPERPQVTGNPMELTRLFQNLLANAIKYSVPGRPIEIHIAIAPANGFWEISLTDNGIGIPQEHAERIFQIFQRLHGRNDYGGGTGIGLAVCKKIVERHGGRIWVEAGPEGQGSRFVFTLPDAQKTPHLADGYAAA